MARKENRRVRITKRLLNESFLELLALNPLSRITVTDVCVHADLNRSTYYQYYTDPYDQMNKLEASIIDEISHCLDGEPLSPDGGDSVYPIAKKILDYMEANKGMFQVLLSNHGDISLQKDILTALADKTLPPELEGADGDGEARQKYIFVSTGSFGMIYYWLMSDSGESTDALARRIARYVGEFLRSGT